eukprot:TRINITY_DN6387_c0_g2_i2.p1 TRINITY_DN6387_c0_g2~~TRINITY_DN6387_c0_g2_i2.p1  ORF type:complete len:398 (+),score=39.38 TRINITY_DN6387_c0_g2_i2:28-1221(+)
MLASMTDVTPPQRAWRWNFSRPLGALGLCLCLPCHESQAAPQGDTHWKQLQAVVESIQLGFRMQSDEASTLSNCEDFFLHDGRSPLEIPDTWAEGRSEFRNICMSEGFSVEGCSKVEGVMFKDVAADSTPINATPNFCANLEGLYEAATFLDSTNVPYLRENPDALLTAVEGLLERANASLPQSVVDGSEIRPVPLDMVLEQKRAPIQLMSKGGGFGWHGGGYTYYRGGYGYGGYTGGQPVGLFFFVLVFFSVWNSAMAFALCGSACDQLHENPGTACGTLCLMTLCPHVLVGFLIPILLFGVVGVVFWWPFLIKFVISIKHGCRCPRRRRRTGPIVVVVPENQALTTPLVKNTDQPEAVPTDQASVAPLWNYAAQPAAAPTDQAFGTPLRNYADTK